MASPLRNARLRITQYTPIPDGPGGDATKELILRLKVSRVQKDISDSAVAVVLAQFKALPLAFSQVRFMITIEGVVTDDISHSAHPLADGVEHDPDLVDLEEACITWNNNAPTVLPILEIEHDGNSFRTYAGVIAGFEWTKVASKAEIRYKMQFAVVWSPTDFPGIREWG